MTQSSNPFQLGFKFAGNPLGDAHTQIKSQLGLSLGSELPHIVHDFHLKAAASLKTGDHAIQTSKRAAILGIDPETSLSLDIQVKSDGDLLILDYAKLEFSKPAHLKNLFTTLDELSELITELPVTTRSNINVGEIIAKNEFLSKASSFVENKAGEYLGRFAETGAWKFIRSTAERGRLSENFEKSKEISKGLLGKGLEKAEALLDKTFDDVRLSAFEIAVVYKDDEPKVIFYVTGEIVFNKQIRRKINHIQLPESFMPTLDPHLMIMLGQFYLEREQATQLSSTILDTILDVSGTIEAESHIESVPIEIMPHPGRTVRCDIEPASAFTIKARYALSRDVDLLQLNIHAELLHKQEIYPMHLSMSMTPTALINCGKALTEPGWQISMLGEGCDIQGRLELLRGFTMHPGAISIHVDDEHICGELDTRINLDALPIHGNVEWGIEAVTHQIHIHTFDLNVAGSMSVSPDSAFMLSRMHLVFDELRGSFKLIATRKIDEDIKVESDIHIENMIHAVIDTIQIPELGLKDPTATLKTSGEIDLRFNMQLDQSNESLSVVRINGSTGHVFCKTIDFNWSHLQMSAQHPIDVDVCVKHASHTITGLSDCSLGISWQCQVAPQLSNGEMSVSAIPQELVGRINDIDVFMSDNGVLHFEHGSGFYDARFFNAVIIPENEKAKLLEILEYAPLGHYLNDLASVIVYPHIPGAKKLFDRLVQWRKLCQERGIFGTTKLIPPENSSLAGSLLLFGDDRAADELLPTARRIMDADGIDRYKIEELIDRAFPDAHFDNAGRILKWLNKILSPIPFPPPEVTHLPALSDDPRFIDQIRGLPTANHLYEGDWSDIELANQCYRLAAGFTPEQIEWIIANRDKDFDDEQIDRLRKLLDIKRKILNFEPREGTFIIQDYNIFVFLDALFEIENECLEQNPDILDDSLVSCFRTWLSPADTARLISAGISSRYHGLFVQLNQANLLDYLIKRGTTYARAVFCEMGQHNVRTLSALLMSYLAQDQSMLRKPVNRAEVLTKLLGIQIPVIGQFAPFQSFSNESYIKALFDAASQIFSFNDAYHAAVLRMHARRYETSDAPATKDTPKTPHHEFVPTDEFRQLETALQNLVDEADRETAPLICKSLNEEADPDRLDDSEIEAATHRWDAVVQNAREFIEKYPAAVETPTLKSLMSRLHEALRVASVLDDLEQDNDEVRAWLAHRCCHDDIERLSDFGRSERLHAVVQNLYAEDADVAGIPSDPLVWFTPRAPQKPVHLTIVAAMGIITDGAHGSELESVFQRLQRDYGIQRVRTDTGLVKSLEFNAQRITDALKTVSTPFVVVGYSQGCANMMFTESQLYTGTPEQRHLLDNLVSRNFICSAFNGSVHAVCGTEKYRQSLIEGENIIKNLSISISKPMARLGLALLMRTLDTPAINMSMKSFESLSYYGLQSLSRDAQYKSGVVSYEIQGISKTHVPDALKFMKNHFQRQFDTPNDTQVGADCAHAYPVYNHNESVDLLYREAVPAKPLDIHHWSPLVEEITLVQTERDYQDFDYRGPKSLFLTPWIESLILFGIVR